MKPFMKILLLTGLTVGVFSYAEAQRDRNSGGSSRSGESRQSNVSAQRSGGGERFSRPNASVGNRYNSPANRQIVANRQSTFRNGPSRNGVANRVGTVNRVPAERFNRGVNGYAYNNRYNNSYYRTGYSGYNRGFSYAYGPRYSVIPRNHISIYFGGNPYYFYNGFYYGYYGGYYNPIFPPIGLRIGFLPFGYSSLFIGGDPYYYYNGVYYRPYDDNDYEVVDPPMGATVSSLPKGAKSVTLNGEKMYELNGTYYKEDANSKGQVIYTVVGKNGEINNTTDESQNNTPGNNDLSAPPAPLQMGDVVNQLPEGSKIVTINGEKMYVAPDDTYLQEESEGGVVQYKVVGTGK